MGARLVRLPVPIIQDEQGDAGWSDYSAPLDPDLRAEQFSAALAALVREIGVQTHLLSMSLERRPASSPRRGGSQIGGAQLIGIAR